MIKAIVNADDFGINPIVTAEIERMIEVDAISSTTVMANGACLDDVKSFVKEHPEVSYGVHLCLSEFDSVTKSEALYHAGLTDENGIFIHKSIFRLKNLSDIALQKAIRNELNAQIDIVQSMGFRVSHADSHHHVHTIYPLREVFVEVLKERNINKIRLGQDFRNWRSKKHLILWMQRVKINKLYKSQFKTTEAFYSYSEFIRHGKKKDETIVELMCHPGHPGQQYRDEMKLVETKELAKSNNIELITYNDLH